MRIIDRYMVRGFLAPFIWCIFAFLIIGIIADIFSFIDDIVKYKIPLASIIAFYVYYCPTLLVMVSPMALLLSTIYLLSNLNKHNEIIAMKSGGMSLWRILRPILLIGCLMCVLMFMVNDRIIPISTKVSTVIRRDELEKGKVDDTKTRIIENVAIYGSGNRIVFAKNYDTEKKTLQDIVIHEQDRRANLRSKTTAQSGVWTRGGWKFYKVIMYKIDNSGKILGEPIFRDEETIPLKEKPSDFANREWKPDYMSYRELADYIENFKGSGSRLLKGLYVDLHYKFSFPFINIVIILIGAPFALITTRGGVLIGLGMSIGIGLLYYAVIAVSLAFGKSGVLPPIAAAWLGNVIFAMLGIYLIHKRA